MSKWNELKTLAEKARLTDKPAHMSFAELAGAYEGFKIECTPAAILELIAENERLREQCELNDMVHGTKGRERVAALLAKNEELRKDAVAGALVWKFIDRMGDPAECDPAEKILAEFVAAFDAAMREASK